MKTALVLCDNSSLIAAAAVGVCGAPNIYTHTQPIIISPLRPHHIAGSTTSAYRRVYTRHYIAASRVAENWNKSAGVNVRERRSVGVTGDVSVLGCRVNDRHRQCNKCNLWILCVSGEAAYDVRGRHTRIILSVVWLQQLLAIRLGRPVPWHHWWPDILRLLFKLRSQMYVIRLLMNRRSPFTSLYTDEILRSTCI